MSDLTLEDIARKAGVSRSTISRVVNNHPNVSDDVRQRVMEVIRSTGYQPNAAARTLASQRSWMIGLVLPRSASSFFTDPYYPYLTQGIAYACNQNNYTLTLFLISSREDEEKIFPRISRKGLLDGILVQSGQIGEQLIDRLIHSNIPLVIAGRPFNANGVSYIDVDNVTSAYQAVDHLFKLGRKRVATITGPLNSTVSFDRRQGYLKAYTEHQISLDESLVIEGDFTEEGGYLAMKKLLAANPDAVFAASDIMAVGAMSAIKEAGLSIPQDIAVVGFDDLPLIAHRDLKITTIRQPFHQFGMKAVEVLIDLIENGIEPPRQIIMETELVVRETCGAIRGQ